MEITLSSLLVIICGMSLVLFAAMGIDKALAKRGAWRIPEKTLFLLAILGGALGGIIGMQLFRHKTKHTSFKIGFPIMFAVNIAAVIYLIK